MFYIGFTKLEEWLAAIDPDQRIYLAPVQTAKPNDYTVTMTTCLIAAQVQGTECLYCRMPVSRWQEISGEPFGSRATEIYGRSKRLIDQLWQIVVERVREIARVAQLIEGAPSFPADLILIDGWPHGVRLAEEEIEATAND